MDTIKDKILHSSEYHYDTKFVRCLNVGANLNNCIWESGMWDDGCFNDLNIFKNKDFLKFEYVEWWDDSKLLNRLKYMKNFKVDK